MSDVHETNATSILSSLAVVRDECQFVISGVPDTPETTALILAPLVDARICVAAMALNILADGRASVSFIIQRDDYQAALSILELLVTAWDGVHIQTKTEIARLSMCGTALWLRPGIMEAVLAALAVVDIRIDSCTVSEQAISLLLAGEDVESAVQALQQGFIGLELLPADV